MSLAFANRNIERVHLIDDDVNVRQGYRYSVEDLGLDAEEVVGPIKSLRDLATNFDNDHDAAICDFNLKTKNYSSQNGDELVSMLYEMKVPAVLCTRFADDLPEPVRHRRRQIPVVLLPNQLSADSIREAFEICLQEFSGNFTAARKPWRTMIRIEGGEEVGGGHFRLNLVIPAWNPSIGLTFVVPAKQDMALQEICAHVAKGEIYRCFGHVNLGAEKGEDIFIDMWSLQ